MKKTLLFVLSVIFILPAVSSAQTNKVKNDPAGKWLFEAPYAPQGYTAGTIEVVYSDKKYSTTMAFSTTENKFAGDKVKFENDTLTFNVYIEGQDVAIKLAFVEETKMSGKAIYTEGVVPLSLTRATKKE
jgi:hypothetical protein